MIRSAILTASAVVGGNGLVFALAAAVLMPSAEVAGPLAAQPPAPAPPVAAALTPPSITATPAVVRQAAPERMVTADHPMPVVTRGTVGRTATPVRVATGSPVKKTGGCQGSGSKAESGSVKVARGTRATNTPDGV